jgi:ABC-2 type transport system permease protein
MTAPAARPSGVPAPAPRAILALTLWELRLALRRGENLLVTIVVPAVVLLFFTSVPVLTVPGRAVDFLLPGSIALAVIATCLVSLGISTAYERAFGVLKRLGGAPLPGGGLVAARVLALLVIETAQIAVLFGLALLLGWAPAASADARVVAAAVVLGSLAFAGIGLLMAGHLRAEATLAIANGLFLAFLLLGGVIVPLSHFPEPLAAVASMLPATVLADALRVGLGQAGDAFGSLATLLAWAVGAIGLAVATFRWD